jgi:RND family efflux transporter MFP subunit
LLLVVVAVVAVWALVRPGGVAKPADAAAKSTARPALVVTTIVPEQTEWPQVLTANGSVAAWQEAVIGAEISNYRLAEVLVNVGDRVAKGQLLARVASDSVQAELAQSTAAVAEAEALLAEARANGERARRLEASGFISGQQVKQYLTAEQAAVARLDAARAKLRTDELRLAYTRVLAPDAGVISARSATVGSLTQAGQELFRLIRGGRIEWRAEVPEADLGRLHPGLAVRLIAPDGSPVQGQVRSVAPTVDGQTRNGLAYVDLPGGAAGTVRAGMFARGEFELGSSPAMTIPQAALVLREGFAYVFRLESGGRVAQTKVTPGRRLGDRVEITDGLDPAARLVATGAGFLADGDLVELAVAAQGGHP